MKLLQFYCGALVAAVDFWLAVIIVLHAFGKPIPWYLWALFTMEFVIFAVKHPSKKARADEPWSAAGG